MTFVYPLGDGSKWENNELKISIALVKKHYQGNADFLVVGSRPNFKVDFVENEIEGSRYQKSMSNIVKGLQVVGEPFVLMNDDFFCSKDFSDIPLFWDMKVTERIKLASSPIYSRFLERSISNVEDKNFAVHKPMMVEDLDLFLYMANIAIKRNCSVRILYGNHYGKNEKQEQDIKLKKKGAIGDWWSIGDQFLNQENKEWLKSLIQGTTEESLLK